MKIAILLMLFAIAASLPLKAGNAKSLADSAPTAELIYYPKCGYPQGSAFWLMCDSLED